MSEELVKEYYTSQVYDEWRRLVKDAYHLLEFITTLHFLDKYLPPHGLILDAGGGPGRYTVELARRGYDVTLFDLVQENLEFAKRQIKRQGLQARVKQTLCGSIVDLSCMPDTSYDAVLCSGGPLSHLIDPQQRKQAVSEMVRVAKPGAPILVSVMGRISVVGYFLAFAQYQIELPEFAQVRDTGDYLGGQGFTACHFFLPEELRQAFTIPELEILEMAGLEGISTHHDRRVNLLAKNETRYKIWLETHIQTCTHPSVVGMSEHMLIVCRKSIVSIGG